MANETKSVSPAAPAEVAAQKAGIWQTMKDMAPAVGKAVGAVALVAGAGAAGYYFGCKQSAGQGDAPALPSSVM